MDHLELSPIPGINVSLVTGLSEKDDKDTNFSVSVIKIDVDYCDILVTKEISEMPEIPGLKYTAEVVCHDTICITLTLLPYCDRNGSGKLTICNIIKVEIAVMQT